MGRETEDDMMPTKNILYQQRNCWSIAEVAERNGVSKQFVRLEISRGRLRAKKVSRRILISVQSEAEWLENAPERDRV